MSKEIDKHRERERLRIRKYRKKYPEKNKASRKKWDDKNRNEYQRAYRASKKLKTK